MSPHKPLRSSLALVGVAGAAVFSVVGGASAAPSAALAAPSPAVAATGTITVPVVEDTYSVPASKNRVTGSYSVVVAGDTVSDRRTAYLKFVVQPPAGATHLAASLRLTTGARTVPGATVQVLAVPSTWSESTLTAANAPAPSTVLGSAPAVAAGHVVSIGVGPVGAGTVEYALRLQAPSGSSVPFLSRESGAAGAAQLVVTYTIPGPATEYGESVHRAGTDWTTAVSGSDAKYGRSRIDRVYYTGLPAPWPGDAGSIDRDIVVSFKADPKQVLSGALDATLGGWFRTSPTDREIYWSYFHEPEDQISSGTFTAVDYRAAWAHLAALAHAAGNPHLHATLILMSWTVNPKSGRTFSDYYPGSGVIDVLGWDAYSKATDASHGIYTDPAEVFGAAVSTSQAAGKPFGFAEWGSVLAAGDAGAGRAAWIAASGAYQHAYGAIWSTYFDSPVGAEYRLLDAPSAAALRALVSGS